MNLFDVYPINNITIVKAKGSYVWDDNDVKYLDMYGGHAVISIGHTNPHWVKRIEDQLHQIAFIPTPLKFPYSNSLQKNWVKFPAKKITNYSFVIQEQKQMRMH